MTPLEKLNALRASKLAPKAPEPKTAKVEAPFETLTSKANAIKTKYPQVKCEIIGSWLWVSNTTKEMADGIKSEGLTFSGKKCMWYYHEGKFFKTGRTKTHEEIKNQYNTHEIHD
jgi:hypothetical protein